MSDHVGFTTHEPSLSLPSLPKPLLAVALAITFPKLQQCVECCADTHHPQGSPEMLYHMSCAVTGHSADSAVVAVAERGKDGRLKDASAASAGII
jgi:hypothetical protein